MMLSCNTAQAQNSKLVSKEIRYRMPHVGEVFLVWGINGWAVVPEQMRPAGTALKNNVMHTPMQRADSVFVAKVRVPAGARIDYGFLTTKLNDGTAINRWEANGKKSFRLPASQDGAVEVKSALTLAMLKAKNNRPVTQEIRYHAPEAGEVSLVWGINGWAVVPEGMRPAGTTLKKAMMHTPMQRNGNVFAAKVLVPAGAIVNYGFLTTKDSNGKPIKGMWDGNKSYRKKAMRYDVVEAKATRTLVQADSWQNAFGLGPLLLIGISVISGIGIISWLIMRRRHRRA
jgi:hypothetical protein